MQLRLLLPFLGGRCHFHTLSEHTLAGRRFPMEQHAVFREDSTGRLAVIGLFYEVGDRSAFLAELSQLPRQAGETVRTPAHINVADSLPQEQGYWTYQGSLTTPPCSETVTWIVLRRPAQMSEAQFQALRDIMGNNFRPLQPSRTVAAR